MTKTYFITGTCKGIGLSLVKQLSKNLDNKIIATVQDIAAAAELTRIAEANPNIHIIELDVASAESVIQLKPQLEKHAPHGIDVFISNAGHSDSPSMLLNSSRDTQIEHYLVNAVGPVEAYKACHPYLLMKDTKKAFFLTSIAASNTLNVAGSPVYACSKAALNRVVTALSAEVGGQGFTVVALHPGIVETDLLYNDLKKDDFPDELKEQYLTIAIKPEISAKSVLEVIDRFTSESNGKFLTYEGEELPW